MGRKKVIDKSIEPEEEVNGSNPDNVLDIKEEERSLEEEEANQPLPEEASLQDALNMDENTLSAELVETGADAEETLPAELDLHTDTAIAQELDREAGIEPEEAEQDKKNKKEIVKKVKKIRSKRYVEASQRVEKNKIYPLEEALELVKSTANTKFDATIEAHIHLDVKKQKGKATESIRGVVKLPCGPIKKNKVIILDEEKIDQILKSGKADFDIALAKPADMPKIAKLAKILGPQGKMPNPKVGTVTEDPEKTRAEIEAGQVEYRADSFNIVHLGIGKASWENEKIKSNLLAVMQMLNKYKAKTITLSSTMGPGIKTLAEK